MRLDFTCFNSPRVSEIPGESLKVCLLENTLSLNCTSELNPNRMYPLNSTDKKNNMTKSSNLVNHQTVHGRVVTVE